MRCKCGNMLSFAEISIDPDEMMCRTCLLAIKDDLEKLSPRWQRKINKLSRLNSDEVDDNE